MLRKVLAYFVILLLLCAEAHADFYDLNQRWEQSHTELAKSRQRALDNGFSEAIVRQSSSSESVLPPAPVLRKTLTSVISEGTVEIEQNQSLVIEAANGILKYIATDEGVVDLANETTEILIVKGASVGTTYVHLWNAAGRNTIQIRVIPQKIVNPAYQKKLDEALHNNSPFKIRYQNDRSSLHSGDKNTDLHRRSLDFNQSLALYGDTPYGNLHTHASTQKSGDKTLLSDAQLRLSNGTIGPYKNFNAMLGDDSISPNLMALPSARIRGASIEHWDDKKRLVWDGFYGREQSSIIGTLSPGLITKRTRNSKLGGAFANFKLNDSAIINGGYFLGSGRSRDDVLNRAGTGVKAKVKLGEHVTFEPETDYDSERIAQKHNLRVNFERLKMRTEVRDIHEDFQTLVGAPAKQGEKGYLFDFSADVLKNLSASGSIDIFRDRLIANPLDSRARNIHTDLGLSWNPFQYTTAILTFQDNDDTGRIGPTRQRSLGAQVNQLVEFGGHRYSFFTRYNNRGSRNLNIPTSDFVQNQVIVGVQTQIFWGIDFSAQREWVSLKEPNIRALSFPSSTVFNWTYSHQLWDTPFFTDLSFRIRDEEETESINSFMSGEDSMEFSGTLYYRPSGDFEFFLTGSIQNFVPESQNVLSPRVEAQFLTGMKYIYDTQIRWSPKAAFSGSVYKDVNGDGKRDASEPGLSGVRIVTSDGHEAVTDESGNYEFPSLAGQTISFNVDVSKLPYGYAPTSPTLVDVAVKEKSKHIINFGATPRSELTGIIFNDANRNQKYDLGEKGIKKIKVILENGKIAKSNEIGVFGFSDVTVGEHTVSLDMISLPEGYLPFGKLKQTVSLTEGIRYQLNIPLNAIRNITGRVYLDANNNGQMDMGESTLSGVAVAMGSTTVTSDADGWYLFDDVAPGDYDLVASSSEYLMRAPIKISFSVDPSSVSQDISLIKKS